MKKRQNNVQKFSTFLSFSESGNRLTQVEWIVDSRLECCIEQQIRSHPNRTAEGWALHFLTVLQSGASKSALSAERNSVGAANKHLSAFLQEVCYQAAQKLQRQFQSIQYKYSLADLFQIGNLLVNQPEKLFRSFNSTYSCSSLESYARTAIFRFIGNTIYAQDIEAKREKFSDYGLLRDLSGKELKEALALSGIEENQIHAYCLARHCYSAVYQPQIRQNSRSLDAPSQGELIQIAACYSQQTNLLVTPTQLVDPRSIQMMLTTCIQAARDYRTNRVLTLESDDVISDLMPTPWEWAIQIEERQQVEILVAQLFTTVPATGQILLKLWLGLDFTQTEIAAILKPKHPDLQKQYQVARHLGRCSRNLLKEYLRQCQQFNPNLAIQDDKVIELIKESLDGCLQTYCKRLVYSDLDRCVQQLGMQEIAIEQAFLQAFENQLEQDLNLPSDSLRFVHEKIAQVVSEWLQSVD